jgi:hypothetical protein
MGSEASGAPSTGGSGVASTGPDGTASTGGASTMGAAFALRTGGPPRRVEEHAPSVSAEQITAIVSQRGFVIVVLATGPSIRTKNDAAQVIRRNMNPG